MCSAIRFGIFPNIHKIAGLKLIPKAGKDTSTTEGLRPISKINCMGKVLEYFIATKIEHELSGKAGLSDRQYGFRKGYNTEEAIILVTKKIEVFVMAKYSVPVSPLILGVLLITYHTI